MKPTDDYTYAGFWRRTGASLIDMALSSLLLYPLLLKIYGTDYFTADALFFGWTDFFLSFGLPMAATVLLWKHRQSTPGKMLLGLRVIDAVSGAPLGLGRGTVRYLGYFVAAAPLGLGLLWVAIDPRRQGWHDKLGRSVVVCRSEKKERRMQYSEQYRRAVAILAEKGLLRHPDGAPLWRLLWRLGIPVRPPYFNGFRTNFRLAGVYFGAVFGLVMFVWAYCRIPEATLLKLAVVVPIVAILSGLTFGLLMAWHFGRERSRHGLPDWDELA